MSITTSYVDGQVLKAENVTEIVTKINANETSINGLSTTKVDKVTGKSLVSDTTITDLTDTTDTSLHYHSSDRNRSNHTGTQSPSTIIQDSSNRFVTDTEKSTWNGKATQTDIDTSINAIQSEITSARGGEVDLATRINKIDSSLSDKATQASVKFSTIYSKAIKDLDIITKGTLIQAQKAICNGVLNVVVWGDSISQGADQVLASNAWVERFKSDLIKALPLVTINFRNYSYGGKNSSDAVSDTLQDLSSIMPFYDTAKTWKDNVKSFNPDLIIFAFGMNDTVLGNDADILHTDNIGNLKAYINTWAKIPSLVLATTILPKTGDLAPVNDRLRIQRATRNFAKKFNHACIDSGRLWNILQRGFDDDTRYATLENAITSYPLGFSGNTTSYVKDGASLIGDNLTNKSIIKDVSFYDGQIKVVFYNRDTNTTYIKYRVNSCGYYMVKLKTGVNGSVALYSNGDVLNSVVIDLATDTTHTLTIDVNGGTHTISVDYIQKLTCTDFRQMHDGTIIIGGDGLTPNIGAISIINNNAIIGDVVYSDDDLLGVIDSVQSGNHDNHPTGLGHALAFVPAYTPIIKELIASKTTDVCNYIPTLVKGNTMGQSGLSSPTANSGETLYFKQFTPRDYKKGISLNIISTGETYTLSSVAVDYWTAQLLEPKHFCYYHDAGGMDYFLISKPVAEGNYGLDFNLFSWI